ncbi:MAG: primosomal protein N' [Alphaproteobacteria bacterium]|nr:primosomal protein N' [Alphaproteobacteria bacterium]
MTQNDMFEEPEESLPPVDASRCVSVLVPYPVDRAYDYGVPHGEVYEVGDYVIVPLGGREVSAVVWGVAAGDVNPKKLKYIVAKHKAKPMVKAMRDFIDWVADYTMTPRGYVLKMALSVPAGLELPKPAKGYKIKDIGAMPKVTQKQQAVLDAMSDGTARIAAEIARDAEVSAGVVKGLLGKGLLEEVDIFNPAPCKKPDPFRDGAVLSEDQDAIAQVLKDAVKAGGYHASLLDGVTGAGKTEVYFEAVAAALKKGRQVVILLPEIALSNAFLDRFQARFGCAPAMWHSHLSQGARRTTWRGVAEGHTKVVIGARSALFLPYQDLGLIIVDEEHDSAYKQEDGVIYHARDMAVVRAHMGGFPIVLVSATPSLETIHNAWLGRYEHLTLPDRFGGARMPQIETIDMRVDKCDAQHFISPTLKAEITETIQSGSQVLLFLNRRGYAPLTLCRTCGHRMECPRCTAWLVEHKRDGKLQCHHCGYATRPPQHCPECSEENSFAACGPGVERVYEEAKAYFPDANILLLASDTAENNEQLKRMLQEIKDDKIDIVIGTQIIAKGHHFPNLTLVGVVDADLGLTGGELRAAERCYQLLHQVAGRAGRAEKPGKVMLQTYMPEHRIMQALAQGARDPFLETEAAEREAAHMPPYSRLVGVIVSGRDEGQVVELSKALGRLAPHGEGIMTLGPAPAPFTRLRGKFRYRLLVQADKKLNIQTTISAWINSVKCPSTVRIYIDIDPQSFL